MICEIPVGRTGGRAHLSGRVAGQDCVKNFMNFNQQTATKISQHSERSMKRNYSDEEIIKAIQDGGPALNKAMRFIYEESDYRNSILRYIQSKNGSLADAEDVFQDGIRHFILNIRQGKYEAKSSLRTYLSVICKNIWLNKFRRVAKLQTIKEEIVTDEKSDQTPESQLISTSRGKLLQSIIAKVGEECKKVLGLWSLGYSFKEIGSQTGKAEGTARKQKHDCFKKVMAYLKERPTLLMELKK